MKKILAVALLLSFSGYNNTTQAQDKSKVKTETIIVKGVCGMCKTRIEDAAYIKGVKRADWNSDTKKLVVVYSPQKTSIEKIEKSIADKGHDAGNTHADKSDYKKLPSCCAYNDNAVCDH